MITRLIAAFRRWVARRRREALLARINAEIAERRRKHLPCRDLIRRRIEITHAHLFRRVS